MLLGEGQLVPIFDVVSCPDCPSWLVSELISMHRAVNKPHISRAFSHSRAGFPRPYEASGMW